jgi:hypothetical protein
MGRHTQIVAAGDGDVRNPRSSGVLAL